MNGKIIKNISNSYVVDCASELITCTPRGKFRYDKRTPLVGDYVNIDPTNGYILEILPRKNVLTRPDIANIDVALVITSVKEPNLDLLLLDKLLTNIIKENIEPIICFTKRDLLNNEEQLVIDMLTNYYNKIGIKTIDNNELTKLDELLSGKIVVLTGQTGAGKSSLINKLNPNFNLQTSPISKALGRGVHTTRHTELYQINDYYVADTPGFSSVDLNEVDPEIIKKSFIEFKNYPCKYQDCKHTKENECSVKDAVNQGKILKSRYDNYLKIIETNRYKKY